ncbi:hypothetical protein SUFG_00035 [Sulfitobacter phage phiCB2047-B]|uniref:Uncharacterized protein n=1 Tax=Sulfitobacter phage phiCB2047-B TaxID=754046 RepID=M4PMZ0_9CAUD|nr:hypothetical protein SUFG_00035 [Sulfitobacter phage phiCB2047-B]AGH07403.1 hypothetical protein SUFG_00035 [Sulfitobacter phage phiCB2047-B]
MSDEAREVTKKCFEKDFLNAKTPYDQWVTFQSVLDWAVTSSRLSDEKSVKINDLIQNTKDKPDEPS